MAAVNSDRNLLFALLALQNGLIDQAALVSSFHTWTRDKAREPADLLVARGDLDADRYRCELRRDHPPVRRASANHSELLSETVE